MRASLRVAKTVLSQASEIQAPRLRLLVQHSNMYCLSVVLWQHQPTIHIH